MRRHSLSHSGFSLIEIILALGIIAFALVGILGLFPVAVNAATDSQRETQAALIARSIFEQLLANPESTTRTIRLADKFDDNSNSVTVNLQKPGAPATIGYDSDGKPVAGGGASAYEAEISILPLTGPPNLGVSEVTVTIRPKGATGLSYPFASLLLQK